MKKYQKILIIIGAVMTILIIAIVFAVNWRGSTKEIVAVADQFQPPASWELVSENVRSPQVLCWDGGGCPYVHRKWSVDGPVSKVEFDALLQNSGWDFSIEKDCQLPANVFGAAVNVCSADGSVGEYDVSLRISANSDLPAQQDVNLTVHP